MNTLILKSFKSFFKVQQQGICIFIVLALLCGAATWYISGEFAASRMSSLLNQVQSDAEDDAKNIALNINQRIFQAQSIPNILSKDYYVLEALKTFQSPAEDSQKTPAEKQKRFLSSTVIDILNARLNEIRTDNFLHTLFVLNLAGDCIAAGKPQEVQSFIGMNYSDRKYFLEAQDGHPGRQFAVGRTDDIRALFYSKPVLDSGNFLGAIVSRIYVDNLTNLALDQDVFVTDENGVVILAKDPELLMKTLPGSKCLGLIADVANSVYKQSNFERLELAPFQSGETTGLVRWKKAEYPYVHAVATVKDEQITVHVLRDLKQVLALNTDRKLWFYMVSLAGILLLALCLGIIEYIRSISFHRKELIALNENLNLLARTDTLTGCSNRRSFYEALENERLRSIRHNYSFSVLSIDIDHFKNINDAYGHPAGDTILRTLVAKIVDIIRPTDMIGRVGGEEFGILLVQTVATDAVSISERIRTAIEHADASHENIQIHFTVSIGVTQWRFTDSESLDILISRCDNALYEAKRNGRNQVVLI